MKPRIYIESSVISYLTSRSSRDLVVSAHQQITTDFWERIHRFDMLDALGAQIQSNFMDAIPGFRRMHVTAIAINIAQLVLIVWSLVAAKL